MIHFKMSPGLLGSKALFLPENMVDEVLLG